MIWDYRDSTSAILNVDNNYVDACCPTIPIGPVVNCGVECIDYIKQQLGSNFTSYLEGSIIKYIHRYKYKNSNIEDLKKASWYLDFLIKHYEEL